MSPSRREDETHKLEHPHRPARDAEHAGAGEPRSGDEATRAAFAGRTDEELVRDAQQGDNHAFDELVRRYRDKVYRLAFKILRHEDDAAETLQDAFLSAYRGIKNFKAESTFSTWLYRVATNAALMKYRRRREGHYSLEQSQNRSGEEVEPLAIPDWSALPEKDLLDAETRQVMEEGIERLPEDLRTVFILRDIEELTNAEVAERLGVSIAAVKSRLHRGRTALRDRLNRYFADKMTRRDRGNPRGT